MKFPSTAGIYQILNTVNGKIYVGSSVNLQKRYMSHLCELNKNNHSNKHLQRAWNKYKEHNFDFEILQLVKNPKSLIECEQFWIDKTNCVNQKYGYNSSPTAGNTLGVKFSEETKKTMSVKRKGRKLSKKHIQQIIKSNTGRKHTEETKKKMSEIAMNNPLRSSMMTGEKNPFYGKKHTQESREKMSKSHIGVELSAETKKKMSMAATGRIVSKETRDKLSIINKGKILSEEAKLKMSIAKRGDKSPTVKLNKLQIKIIRSLKKDWKNKLFTLKDLSDYFNIDSTVISKIMNNKIWKYI